MHLERLKKALEGVVLGLLRPLDYFALYPAKVVAQNPNLSTIDVQPESARIAPLTAIPFRFGLPGVWVKVSAGARVLVGFENGDPIRPYACLWDTATVEKVYLLADKIYLGAEDDLEPAVRGTTLKSYLDALKIAFDTHTHISAAPASPTAIPVPLSPSVPNIAANNVEVY